LCIEVTSTLLPDIAVSFCCSSFLVYSYYVAVTLVGWQAALCDPIWQVRLRSFAIGFLFSSFNLYYVGGPFAGFCNISGALFGYYISLTYWHYGSK